jgi:hypothetical protein
VRAIVEAEILASVVEGLDAPAKRDLLNLECHVQTLAALYGAGQVALLLQSHAAELWLIQLAEMRCVREIGPLPPLPIPET